jgi:RNA polymerase sigma factor for flagellar operon FliA
MLALVLSAGAYDPERGVPFRGFAALRIRGALIDELRSMDWASRSVRSRGREVETVRALLTTTLGRPPRTDEIADAMAISAGELEAVYADLARGTVLSLQGLAAEVLCDPPASRSHCPESLILRREQLGYLHDAIAALSERLRFVVIAYYFQGRQMSDIAVDLSVTQSRVSQMCTEATTLMRDGMNSQLDPDALRAPVQTGRAAALRNAYFRKLVDRSTVAGRLDMSTSDGDMRGVYPENVEPSERSRIA